MHHNLRDLARNEEKNARKLATMSKINFKGATLDHQKPMWGINSLTLHFLLALSGFSRKSSRSFSNISNRKDRVGPHF